MGDLPVGKLRSGETVVDFAVGIPGSSLATHIGIFATTGMGKSNLMQVLAGGVMRANGRYGLLVIDPHGEYRTALARHPWAPESLRVYANRSLPGTSALKSAWRAHRRRPAHRLRLEPAPGGGPLRAGAPLQQRGSGLAGRLRPHRGPARLPGRRAVRAGGAQHPAGVHRRARRIVDLRCVATDPGVSVGGRIVDDLLAGKVVLVDVSGLGSTEEVLVASFLARRVLETWQAAYLDDPDRHPACRSCRSPSRRPSGC
jgi:hypothetical protein